MELLVWGMNGWIALVLLLLLCLSFFAAIRLVEWATGRVASWWYDRRDATSKDS